MRSYMFLLSVLPLSMACPGCAVWSPPQVKLESNFGVVRAESSEEAERVVGLLEQMRPKVEELFSGLRGKRVEIWVKEELSPAVYAYAIHSYERDVDHRLRQC